MDTDRYQYKPLKPHNGTFRLLRLKKGRRRVIECELVHAVLEDEKYQYEAVSYTWGKSVNADSISIDGAQLPVTLNLSWILRDLRSLEEDRILWVDTLSINQNDNIKKGHQVEQMKNVCKNAKRVLFCTSRPREATDLLIDCLRSLQNLLRDHHGTPGNSQLLAIWEKLQVEWEKEHYALKQRQQLGLEHILVQPWFSRVWILQEVANARDALIHWQKMHSRKHVFRRHPFNRH
jgi:hypothetical protein